MVKKIIRKILRSIIQLIAGKEFASKPFSELLLFKYVIIQKIFRINSHVPWPVHWTSKIINPEKIKSGTRAPGLAVGCYLDGRNEILIEENVWIGPKVSLISMNHDVNNYQKFIISSPIIIRKNCWLATNCTITAGVELGEHTIVAAGAVVTKSFIEGNQILAGIPAKPIKKLSTYRPS